MKIIGVFTLAVLLGVVTAVSSALSARTYQKDMFYE